MADPYEKYLIKEKPQEDPYSQYLEKKEDPYDKYLVKTEEKPKSKLTELSDLIFKGSRTGKMLAGIGEIGKKTVEIAQKYVPLASEQAKRLTPTVEGVKVNLIPFPTTPIEGKEALAGQMPIIGGPLATEAGKGLILKAVEATIPTTGPQVIEQAALLGILPGVPTWAGRSVVGGAISALTSALEPEPSKEKAISRAATTATAIAGLELLVPFLGGQRIKFKTPTKTIEIGPKSMELDIQFGTVLPEEGYTRLYRGESGAIEDTTSQPSIYRDRWFTTDKQYARLLANIYNAPNRKLKYIDIPTTQLSTFSLKNYPEAAKVSLEAGGSVIGEKEFILPSDLTKKAIEIPFFDIPPPGMKKTPQIDTDKIFKAMETAKESRIPVETTLSDQERIVYQRLKPQIEAAGQFRIPIRSILNQEELELVGLKESNLAGTGIKINNPIPDSFDAIHKAMAESGIAVTRKGEKYITYFDGKNTNEISPAEWRIKVAENMPNRLRDMENVVVKSEVLNEERMNLEATAGNTIEEKKGNILNYIGSRTNFLINRGLSSASPLARSISKSIRFLIGSAGTTPERATRLIAMEGKRAEYNLLADDCVDYLDQLIKKNPESANRVGVAANPELYKNTPKGALSLEEQKALEFYKKTSNLIHDQNFALGMFNEETYLKNMNGKYVPEIFDFPFDEKGMPDSIKSTFKRGIDINMYKRNMGYTKWKEENAIKDIRYLMEKRMRQTGFNTAMVEHFSWLSKQKGISGVADLVSDTARPGFIELGDSKRWGALAGKFVRQDALEDTMGPIFLNRHFANFYDWLTNSYGKWIVRKFSKASLTAYNPLCRLGNSTSNLTFSAMIDGNPIKTLENFKFGYKEFYGKGANYRRVIKDGYLGTGYSAVELMDQASKIRALSDTGILPPLKKLHEFVVMSYRAEDDIAKLASLKTLMDKEIPYEQAIQKVYTGFQSWRNVSLAFDIYSKLPILGNPFITFQSELLRIMTTNAVKNPARLISMGLTLKFMSDYWSNLSGETKEDRKIRESRAGFSHVPIVGLPLEFQTPWGLVDIGRFVPFGGGYSPPGGRTFESDIQKFLPIPGVKVPGGIKKLIPGAYRGADFLAKWIAMSINDPTLGPAFQAWLVDKDFRAKPISDPKENIFGQSSLTPTERLENTAGFLFKSYSLPTIRDVYNVLKVTKTGENIYGQKQTLQQAYLRLLGMKMSVFGKEEAAQEKVKRIQFYLQDIKTYQMLKRKAVRDEDIDIRAKLKRLEYWDEKIKDANNDIQRLNRNEFVVEE